MRSLLTAVLASGLASTTTPVRAQGPAPAPGVYECMVSVTYGTGVHITQTFALVSPNSYMWKDGSRGNYAYDPGTGLLAMTSGPNRGSRYKRVQPQGNSFRVLTSAGEVSGANCVLNTKKSTANRQNW